MRIYVGGFGGVVTPADIEKTFSSLGKVGRVDLVPRSEGRCFAFMDFEPNSDKSLARLFATYNGCIWKGGRLKLEKAKEHYIDRLRREWAADAEDHVDHVANKDGSKLLEESKCAPQEKMQIRIFFPKLRKVKGLPYKGTGKHKYSFQRVTVPSLPIHFCDCEEHCKSYVESGKSPNDQNGTIGKEELNVMHSVMNKLFEKDRNENAADVEPLPSGLRKTLESSDDAMRLTNTREVSQEPEDDNFVMNIGTGESNSLLELMLMNEREKIALDLDGRKQTFHGGLNQHKENSRKRQETGNASTLEITSDTRINQKRQKTGNGDGMETNSDDNGKESPIVASGKKITATVLSQQPKEFSNLPSDDNDGYQLKERSTINHVVDHTARGSWVQKCSWRGLVGDAKSSAFSISHVLRGVKSENPTSFKSDDIVANSNNARKVASQPDRDSRECPEGDQSVQKVTSVASLDDKQTSRKDEAVTEKRKGKRSNGSDPGITSDMRISQKMQKTGNGDGMDANSDDNGKESPVVASGKKKTSSALSQQLRESFKVISDDNDGNELKGNLITNDVVDQYARGSSWVQKCSWRDLVGDANSSTFSISHALPGINSVKPTFSNSGDMVVANSNTGVKVAPKPDGDCKKYPEVDHAVQKVTSVAPPDIIQISEMEEVITENTKVEVSEAEKEKNAEESKAGIQSIVIGEVCTFMRSAESEKQWTKAKKVLSGFLKKKSNMSATLKSPKEGPRRKYKGAQ